MKYLIIGAGGTGGALGGYLCLGGYDVTLIARGDHLEAIRQTGLHVTRPRDEFTVRPNACTMDEYSDVPDVIFVCVKGYSLDEAASFIRRIAKPHTIVIPILNIYGTGSVLQKELPDCLVTDGCIYVASQIASPGRILMKGDIMRVVFGVRSTEEYDPRLEQIRDDLCASQVLGLLSDNISRDALLKFSYVSAQNAAGLYYGIPAGPMQKDGPERSMFAGLVSEINTLANASGIRFEEDIVASNLKILDDLSGDMTTSMQRDIAENKPSEIDGLIYNVVRLGDQYDLELPLYRMIAQELHSRDL